MSPIPMANDSIDHAALMKASLTPPPQDGGQRAARLVHMWRIGESVVPRKHMEAPPSFPIPCSTHTFHLAVPGLSEIYPFITNL